MLPIPVASPSCNPSILFHSEVPAVLSILNPPFITASLIPVARSDRTHLLNSKYVGPHLNASLRPVLIKY